MSKVPQANVVGIFNDPAAANLAVDALHEAGVADAKVGVESLAERTLVTVQADGKSAEVAAQLEDQGAHGVQTVAR